MGYEEIKPGDDATQETPKPAEHDGADATTADTSVDKGTDAEGERDQPTE